MRMSSHGSSHHSRVLAATLLWLAGGSILLLSTLVPAHTAMLGWTPAFWLLAAPLLVLLVMRRDPSMQPRSRRDLRRHRVVVGAIWN